MGAFAVCASLLLLSSSFNALLCASGDSLLPGGSLLMNQTLVSAGGTFALGFFTPGGATASRHYLGIWYSEIPNRTVVWVANRENPFTDSSVVLRISNDSNLVVSDTLGGVLWSSNISGEPPAASGSGMAALLQDTGNLELRAGENDVRWQSFDHPTDTLLPGMRLWVNKRIHVANRIISWKDAGDPSPGNFSYGIEPITTLQTMIWRGTEPYRRTEIWEGDMTTGGPMSDSGYASSYSIQRNDEMANISFSPSDPSVMQRIVIDSTGVLRLFSRNRRSTAWSSLTWYAGAQPCDAYGACGPFGVCRNNGSSRPACDCLDGYEPRNRSDWDRGQYSGGCSRAVAPRCAGDEDEFQRMASVKVPDKMIYLRQVVNGRDCAAACRGNCSCIAYAFTIANYATTNISRCLVWDGEFVDLVQNSRTSAGGEDFYLRVPGARAVASDDKNKLWILWVISPAAVIILCASLWLWCKHKAKIKGWWKNGKKAGDSSMAVWGLSGDARREFSWTKDLLEDEQKEGEESELPVFSFDAIAAATENFSDDNKLGKGGFGDVYVGVLPGGRKIAVKRLSSSSGQGLDEFKTEAVLIAKLQHRNLVRLLGYCIQGEEKILIYEYMPNKSLDFFLFNPERREMLDWGRRFSIIEGVARGILYLHRDSRVRVVHRDLKASNILLDEEMNPKISDFGMARIFGGNQTHDSTNRIVGTFGYMPPEYAMEGLFSVKSDVYSFGVLMLEIVSGRRNIRMGLDNSTINLLGYAWQLWTTERAEEIIDPCIRRSSCHTQQVLRCIHIGLLCVQDRTGDRPTMSSVVTMLDSEAAIRQVPTQPTFAVPEGSSGETDTVKHDRDGHTRNEVTLTIASGR